MECNVVVAAAASRNVAGDLHVHVSRAVLHVIVFAISRTGRASSRRRDNRGLTTIDGGPSRFNPKLSSHRLVFSMVIEQLLALA